ncbi:MAG: hypothetical protein ABIO80_05420 [Sphingomicrobium sp.]
MLHLRQDSDSPPRLYAEAVSRLASIRHALRLVEPSGGGPAPDVDDDPAIAAAWDDAGTSRQQLFERRSRRLVGAAAAGLDALVEEWQAERQPHPLASAAMADQIRRELKQIAGIVLA